MNTRLITIISSISLVSAALSSGTIIPSSSTVIGSTPIPAQSTNNTSSPSSSSIMSTIITTYPPPSVSPTSIPTIKKAAIASHDKTSSISPMTTRGLITTSEKSNISKTSPPQSIISNAPTKNHNLTTPSTAANTKTNNSTQQPAGPRTTVNPVPSTPAKTPVPDTTTEEPIETTVPCDCSKYLPTSTDSENRNTELTITMTSLPTTMAPQITTERQTTTAPLTSSATYTPSNTKTNTSTGNTPTKSIIETTIVPTTLPHTTTVSTITTIKKTGAPITTKPATTTPSTQKPATQNPSTQKPATQKPATPKPATQKPATPKPATPKPATQKPATQNPSTQKPATPKPATPKPAAQKPATQKPATQKPATPKPATPKPATQKPATQNPSTQKPATPKPATPKPATPKPATQKPATQKPATPKPATQKPATQNPSTPKPATQKPSTPQPTTPIPATPEPTTQVTQIPATSNTATAPTTLSNAGNDQTSSSSDKIRRRRDVTAEVTMIMDENKSIVGVDTKTDDEYCMAYCNITIKETTVPPLSTTTERKTTTTPRHRSIDLSGKSVVLQLVIFVNDTFTSEMENKSTSVYTQLANQYERSLTEFYTSLLHSEFRKIVILGFTKGSIQCNYSLEMKAPINESDANSTFQILRNVNWNNTSLTNLTLDVNKTASEQADLLSNDLVFLPANVCVNNEVLEWDNDGNPICKYKCDTPEYKGKCGDHGECSFTYGGAFRCICKDGYSGNKCETPKPTTTTAKPTKPDAIALSKIDIIGIAGGIGGGLVLILLVALCCVYTKLNKAKKRDRFYGYMDNDKEFLHDENSRIENVPDLKNEYTNLGYQTEQDELQMQRFEPEGKNVDYEPGQRQGAYERDDKAYRKVDEPEGGNVLIYQPKHLNGPMERQSGASKFDEVEERSNPYRMMDTDTTYKIRRPTVNSDRNVPYN